MHKIQRRLTWGFALLLVAIAGSSGNAAGEVPVDSIVFDAAVVVAES